MHTRIHYLYRDASNYKAHGSMLLSGELTDEARAIISATLENGETFIPEQIGWPHLGPSLIGFPDDDDHCWHELDLDDAEVVTEPARAEPVFSTVDAWVSSMIEAKRIGWDDVKYGVE